MCAMQQPAWQWDNNTVSEPEGATVLHAWRFSNESYVQARVAETRDENMVMGA
jgi:hypothetical protein